MEANVNQLRFQWSPVTSSEDVRYRINASNCGHCPNETNNTTVICTDFTIDMYSQVTLCLLSLQTVVCDNVTGNENSSVQVNLRGICPINLVYNNKRDVIFF